MDGAGVPVVAAHVQPWFDTCWSAQSVWRGHAGQSVRDRVMADEIPVRSARSVQLGQVRRDRVAGVRVVGVEQGRGADQCLFCGRVGAGHVGRDGCVDDRSAAGVDGDDRFGKRCLRCSEVEGVQALPGGDRQGGQ